MFVLLLVRWLANHHNPWVVRGGVVILVGAAIGIAAAGIAMHQPSITRVGVLLVLASIVYAALVIRNRRARARQ